MKDISKNIIERIKKERIHPLSKARLNWKSYAFWFLMAFMVLLGALFFSLMVLNLTDVDRELFRYLEFRKFIFILIRTTPYLWIFLLTCAVFFGIASFRKTKRGYRHSTLFITSLLVLAISLLGAVVHFFKVNERFDRDFFRGSPPFDKLAHPREGRWARPGDGLLGGEILDSGVGFLVLRNPEGETWRVEYSEKTKIRPGTELEIGKDVGVIGEKTGEFSMRAVAIRNLPNPDDRKTRNGRDEDKLLLPMLPDAAREN